MPFVNGAWSAPANSWNPAVTNTAISSTDFAALLADVTTALSTCVLKDGTQVITASIPMSGFKLTGLAAGTASGNSLRYEQVNGLVTTAGDLLYATGAGTLARLGIGTANKRLITNSGATAPAWAVDYASSGQTVSNAGLLTLAHGLGVEPTLIMLVAQCTSAEANYGVGDRIVIAPWLGVLGASDRGVSVRKDATNIKIRFSDNANPLYTGDATTGSPVGLTSASWQLYVYAWVM